jgi:hypothetical protein
MSMIDQAANEGAATVVVGSSLSMLRPKLHAGSRATVDADDGRQA